MGYAAKIYNSTRSLDLSSGTKYKLMPDFIPPASVANAMMSNGLAGNRYGGATKFDEKFQMRSWTFTVDVTGNSEAEVIANVNALLSMLPTGKGSASSSDPTMFGFRFNQNIPTPLWGQFGAWKSYVIKHATYALGYTYSTADVRKSVVSVQLNLQIDPHALGQQQRVASAAGGIFEDVIGSADGTSKGLVIPEATTNKVVNPVFGASTFDTGYTSTNVVTTKNTDPRFCLPGLLQSARVIGAPGGTIAFSLNVGNTNTHSFSFYVKREDEAAVTSSDCTIYYNGTKFPVFTSLGGGWYRAEWVGAGINSATNTGLNISAGRKIYIGGVQVEEKAAPTPLCSGDMLGCAWTGTAHASTSTRTVAFCRVAVGNDTVMTQAGALLAVWKVPEANTMAGARNIFRTSSNLNIYYEANDDKFYFLDGTNTNTSAAQTFAAGDVLRLIFNYGTGGVTFYKNGASIGTGTYTVPSTFGALLGMGSGTTGGNSANGTFLLFQTYDHELSAAEITAIDGELSALIAAGKRPSPTPWLWTKDGDNVLDNCDDSTRDNWCVIAGVAGNAPAKYKHYIGASAIKNGYWLGGIDLPEGVFSNPTEEWFYDHNNTADAAYCGGGYRTWNSGTSTIISTLGFPASFSQYLYTKHTLFCRMSKASTTGDVTVSAFMAFGGALERQITSSSRTIALTTTNKNYYIGSIKPDQKLQGVFYDFGGASLTELDDVFIGFNLTTAFDVRLDYYIDIPGRVTKIIWNNAYAQTEKFFYDGEKCVGTIGNSAVPTTVIGDSLEILPGRNNLIFGISADDAEAHALADTLTFTTFITPRWSLL